jgi:hypothetical protein
LSLTARVVKSLAPVTTSRPALHYCTTAPARLCHRCVIPLQSCTDTCKKKERTASCPRASSCMHACPVSSSKDSGARRQTKLSPRTAGCLPHHFLRGRVVSLWRPSALASRLIPCFITIIISVPKASICTSMRDRCLKQTWGIPAVRSDPWSRLKESFTGSSNERGI